MTTDADLLQRYVQERSDAAFAELVRRHLDGVYASALRRVGFDTHLAKDVSQTVFIALARQSRLLLQHSSLSAWLHTATRNASVDLIRRERRRKNRENTAATMIDPPSPGTPDWSRLAPILDDSIDELPVPDRDAILLRYISRRPFAEIGATLRISEDAARMRVDRALEKLRVLLSRRGLTSTGAALGLVLANNASAAAPASIASGILASLPAQSALAASIAGAFTIFKFSLAAAVVASVSVGYYVFAEASAPPTPPTGTVGQPVLTSSPPARNWPPEENEARAFLKRHPKVKKALVARYHASFKTRYGDAYRILALTEKEIHAVQSLLCDSEYYTSIHFPRLRLPVGDGRSLAEVNEALRSFLGEARYDVLQSSSLLEVTARRRVENVIRALAFTDAALTSYQARQLLDVLNTHRPPDGWDTAIARAEKFLSAPQMQVLKTVRAGERYGLLTRETVLAPEPSPGPEAPFAPPVAALYASLTASPDLLAAWLDARHVDDLEEYTPLYEQLALPPAKRSAFDEILREDHLAQTKRTPGRLDAIWSKQRQLLGDTGYRQLRELSGTKPVYPFVTGFAAHAALSGHGLTRQQFEELARALIASAQRKSSGFVLQETIDWARVDELSRSFLTPTQQHLFQTTEQRGVSRFLIQLNNAIRHALELDAAAGIHFPPPPS